MSALEVRALEFVRKAKDHGVVDFKATICTQIILNSTSASESKSCYMTGRATPENSNAFKSSFTEGDLEEISIDIDSSASALVPNDMNLFITSNGFPAELKFEVTDNKLYLLNFWAYWCIPCQDPMAYNQRMLEENPHWEGIAEIISISLDDTAQVPQKKIEEEGWTKVRSYWAGPGEFDSPAAVSYGINCIPTCLLVRNKRVLWKGSPSDRNLEADINGLLGGIPLLYIEPTQLISKEELDAKSESIKKVLLEAHGLYPLLKLPTIYLCHNRYTDGEETSDRLVSYFRGKVIEKYEEIYHDLYEKMVEIVPGIVKGFVKIETLPAISRAKKCSICFKNLNRAETQYICLFCSPRHAHCQKCENLPRKGKGIYKLAHPHHLMKIHPEAGRLDEMMKLYYEPNRALQENPDDLTHPFTCSNDSDASQCPNQGEIVGTRFECLHCPDYDYCQTCAKMWYENSHEALVKTAYEKGHARYHVMLKIAFPDY